LNCIKKFKSKKLNFYFSLVTLLQKVPNVQVSDTTGDARNSIADLKIIFFKKQLPVTEILPAILLQGEIFM